MWTVKNAAKTLVWTKNVLSVFKKQKTEVFENALVWTGIEMQILVVIIFPRSLLLPNIHFTFSKQKAR